MLLGNYFHNINKNYKNFSFSGISFDTKSIKKNKDLSHLALIRQSRLSVMPVDYKSWKIINNMSKI